MPDAHASVAVKLTWSVSRVQIAAVGLAPKIQYQVYLAESDQAFRKTRTSGIKTNLDGGGIVQVIGPLKRLAARGSAAPASSRRFLILTELQDPSQVALRQSNASSGR